MAFTKSDVDCFNGLIGTILIIYVWIGLTIGGAVSLAAKSHPLEYVQVPATLIEIYNCPNYSETGVSGYFHLTPQAGYGLISQFANITYYPCQIFCDRCTFGGPPMKCCASSVNQTGAFLASIDRKTMEINGVSLNQDNSTGSYMSDPSDKHTSGWVMLGISFGIIGCGIIFGLCAISHWCEGRKSERERIINQRTTI